MTRWRYQTIYGAWVEGIVTGYADRGGTDVIYFMLRDGGRIDVLSGSRLREAQVIRTPMEAK